jgi:segregation and condensation protein B
MGITENIEAIIFLGGEGVKLKELTKVFGLSIKELMEHVNLLRDKYKESGILVDFDDETVFFKTNPLCGEGVAKFFNQESAPRKLTAAALETVSIIAYKQPVTRGDIEAIRGVASDSIISGLEDRKFIRICGKRETPGRPNLYEVTDNFLAYLGISSVEELPNYKEMRGANNGENKN